MGEYLTIGILLALFCGFVFAIVGTGMSADMESHSLAGFPAAAIGILAGAVGAIRTGMVSPVPLIVICVAAGAVGAAAGCLSTVTGRARFVGLSGSLFGLLGGALVLPPTLFGLMGVLLAGAIGGTLFGLLNARRQPL
jgi:hypothetical protein